MLPNAPVIRYYQSYDARRLAVRIWERSDALADVIYLHGIVSHGGWYLSSCAHLATEAFQVHFLDRRGSGLNAEGRGDVDNWSTWLADVEAYLETLPAGRPRILLGVSWGGILACAFARHRPGMLTGLGLICPGLFSHKAANTVQRFALRMASSLGLNRLQVQVPLQNSAWFTNSPPAQQYVARDPLALREITIRFANSNVQLLRRTTVCPEEIRVPVLLMLASRDPITDNPRTKEFVGRVGHAQKRIIEYPDASHTLEFEDDPSQYFRDLAAWCTEIAKPNREHL